MDGCNSSTKSESVIDLYADKTQEEHLICKLCNTTSNDNLIILSCKHVFHIYCLASQHFKDGSGSSIIDEDYFKHRKCPTCSKTMDKEELMFLHSKFLGCTKHKMELHQQNVDTLEAQFNKIREELRACYEYKQKLEVEREKSKQLVTLLMTLI